MCREMSQYMPNTAVRRETVARPAGSETQPGIPVRRSETSARRPSRATLPERWPNPSTSSTVVSRAAAAEAPITSRRAAPPAGGAAAASSPRSVTMSPSRSPVQRLPGGTLPRVRLHETNRIDRTVSDNGGPQMTVEQLAYETGMSVRNIRNHQSRGLLPAPEIRARTGYYGEQHVERLRLIQEMQAQGFKLTAIKRLIGEHGGDADRFIDLRRAVTAPFDNEQPEFLTLADLAERFGPADQNGKAIEKAMKLEILVPVDDERFEVPSPSLLRAAEEVVSLGIPLEAAVEVVEKVHRNSQSVARAFVSLFLDQVWKPFDRAGRPDERWEEITESIERLRPLASEALLAVFKQKMTAQVEEAFGKLIEEKPKG